MENIAEINAWIESLDERNRIGAQLKEMRNAAKMSSIEVAETIGAAVGTVYNWENGTTKIPLESAADLLRLYNGRTGNAYSLDSLVNL